MGRLLQMTIKIAGRLNTFSSNITKTLNTERNECITCNKGNENDAISLTRRKYSMHPSIVKTFFQKYRQRIYKESNKIPRHKE